MSTSSYFSSILASSTKCHTLISHPSVRLDTLQQLMLSTRLSAIYKHHAPTAYSQLMASYDNLLKTHTPQEKELASLFNSIDEELYNLTHQERTSLLLEVAATGNEVASTVIMGWMYVDQILEKE